MDQHSIKKSVKAMATQTTRQDALTATASSSHANDGQASAGADVNSALIPGGQPPTGAAAESKGRKLDSNKEKVWLIAVLTAGVVAFAQIKRSL